MVVVYHDGVHRTLLASKSRPWLPPLRKQLINTGMLVHMSAPYAFCKAYVIALRGAEGNPTGVWRDV